MPVLAAVVWGATLLVGAVDAPEPIRPGAIDGEVQVVEDPERFGASVRLVVRAGGADLEAWVRGSAAREVEERQVGEWIDVAGPVRPMEPGWRLDQGVVGRLDVEEVRSWRPGGVVSRAANGLRRTLADGARSMDDADRALYLGLVLGDRRGHDPLVEDAFEGSGLTHVLAVSGSNVAFVLVLVGPIVRRLGFGGRLASTLAVVAFFAVVTRLEPSVLRAATMAGLGACSVTFGWKVQASNLLALAVVVLLLVDPPLATSLGFQLSVAATAGILVLARPLALRMPGPRWLADSLSITVAAQLAVAPLLLPVAGGLPVASLPANLLAVPMTGPVMVWGVPAGMLAGLAGGESALATVLHAPTSWMVSWIDLVARRSAAAPLGHLGASHLVVIGLAVVVVAAVRSARVRAGAAIVGCLVLLHPAAALVWLPPRTADLGPGAALHRTGDSTVLVVESDARSDLVLDGLRRSGVHRIDAVVAVDGRQQVAEVVALVSEQQRPRLVLAPVGHRVRGGSVPPVGAVIGVGSQELVVRSNAPQLEVEITRARGPPVGRSSVAACARRAAGRPL